MKLKRSIDAARETASRQMHDGLERALEAVGLQLLHKSPSVTLSVLAGVGIGILIGGAAALLLAPMPGTDLRKRLQERLADLMPHGSEPAEGQNDKKATSDKAATTATPGPVAEHGATLGANAHGLNRAHRSGDPVAPA